ncbi:MAG: nodulation protein NfeD [Thermodesulfovibrionia bacterium]|nr:nodulation protein NfeD [Thermodesulfovibrionia bacterium]
MARKFYLTFLALAVLLISPVIASADVMVIKAVGVVNPVMSEFISKSIDEAAETSSLLVIQLDTPGGLDTSMRSIVQKIKASAVPIVVYVSPGGARAASAGVFITLSAHIAAMATSTNIGAAHPVSVGEKMDETTSKKAENDAAAYIKSIAESRGRNAEWAEKAVRESVSITETDALQSNVIDLIAPDLQTLLNDIDGRKVITSKGETVIRSSGQKITYKERSSSMKILDFISDPSVAYILMMLGFYGIFFEMTNPGALFPGVFGSISLILAFYSFQTLPVNYAGVLLILLAVILFILEIKIISYGILTIGGVISMLIGSIMLFDSTQPFFRLSLKVILPAVIITVLFFTLTASLAFKAHRRKPATGKEELIDSEGEARTDIHEAGRVFIHGELWNAWSDEPIKKGERVIVDAVENLKLKVHLKTES